MLVMNDAEVGGYAFQFQFLIPS